MTPKKRNGNFVQITNREIYESILLIHQKQDNFHSILLTHGEKIATNRKFINGIVGGVSSIGIALFIFVITKL